ncbi:MAG TPA: hypothetical protein VIL63_05870 [Terriglobales bacterium]
MPTNHGSAVDIDTLLHPARAFAHPIDVVRDDDLTLYEKRAILSSWASDACAVEDFPDLRQASATAQVKFDDIMDALRDLDSELERRVHRHQHKTVEGGPGSNQFGGIPFTKKRGFENPLGRTR